MPTTILLFAIILVVLGLIAAPFSIVLTACLALMGYFNTNTPETIVKAYLEAINRQDIDGAKNFANDESDVLLDEMVSLVQDMERIEYRDFVSPSVSCQENEDATRAVCEVCWVGEAENVRCNDFNLEKIEGEWRIELLKENVVNNDEFNDDFGGDVEEADSEALED